MEPQQRYIDQAIRSMFVKRAAAFGVSFGSTLLLGWVAGNSYGPATDVVYLIASLCGVLALVFGIALFSFQTEANFARTDWETLRDDPNVFLARHRGIFDFWGWKR